MDFLDELMLTAMYIPKVFVFSFGWRNAIVLTDLCDFREALEGCDRLEEGGWFKQTLKKQMENTGLPPEDIRKSNKVLQAKGILKIKTETNAKGEKTDWYQLDLGKLDETLKNAGG